MEERGMTGERFVAASVLERKEGTVVPEQGMFGRYVGDGELEFLGRVDEQ